jgi:hypothetical protein
MESIVLTSQLGLTSANGAKQSEGAFEFFILLIEVLGFPKGFSQGFNLERPSGHDNIGI